MTLQIWKAPSPNHYQPWPSHHHLFLDHYVSLLLNVPTSTLGSLQSLLHVVVRGIFPKYKAGAFTTVLKLFIVLRIKSKLSNWLPQSGLCSLLLCNYKQSHPLHTVVIVAFFLFFQHDEFVHTLQISLLLFTHLVCSSSKPLQAWLLPVTQVSTQM